MLVGQAWSGFPACKSMHSFTVILPIIAAQSSWCMRGAFKGTCFSCQAQLSSAFCLCRPL